MVGYVIFDGPCAFHFLRLRRDGLLNQEWVRVEATLVENCSWAFPPDCVEMLPCMRGGCPAAPVTQAT